MVIHPAEVSEQPKTYVP